MAHILTRRVCLLLPWDPGLLGFRAEMKLWNPGLIFWGQTQSSAFARLLRVIHLGDEAKTVHAHEQYPNGYSVRFLACTHACIVAIIFLTPGFQFLQK